MTTHVQEDIVIAYGRDNSVDDERWYVAKWSLGVEPLGEESYRPTREEARTLAEETARIEGIDAVECDEFGVVSP